MDKGDSFRIERISREGNEPQQLAVDARPLPGGRAVLRLAGELDLASGGQLRDAVDAQLSLGRARLVLDLTELEFIDSTGVSVLIESARKTARADGQLVLATPHPHTARILNTVGLDQVIPVYPDIADAIAATAPGSAGAP